MEFSVLHKASVLEEAIVPGEGRAGRAQDLVLGDGVVLHEAVELLLAIGDVQCEGEVHRGRVEHVLDHPFLLHPGLPLGFCQMEIGSQKWNCLDTVELPDNVVVAGQMADPSLVQADDQMSKKEVFGFQIDF